ncbi:hypothetical protein HYZ97_05170 [Candidatus Pacearchaeota archaeon]|nr:hypothetical protein [Candidatus Pacearchaeota archaeon]
MASSDTKDYTLVKHLQLGLEVVVQEYISGEEGEHYRIEYIKDLSGSDFLREVRNYYERFEPEKGVSVTIDGAMNMWSNVKEKRRFDIGVNITRFDEYALMSLVPS